MSVKRIARKALSVYASPGGWVFRRPKNPRTTASSTSMTSDGIRPMSLAVRRFNGLLVRTLHQAEAEIGVVLEPVGDEAHAELVLHAKVLHMRSSDVSGGRSRDLVAIHEEAHRDWNSTVGLGSEGRALAGHRHWLEGIGPAIGAGSAASRK